MREVEPLRPQAGYWQQREADLHQPSGERAKVVGQQAFPKVGPTYFDRPILVKLTHLLILCPDDLQHVVHKALRLDERSG